MRTEGNRRFTSFRRGLVVALIAMLAITSQIAGPLGRPRAVAQQPGRESVSGIFTIFYGDTLGGRGISSYAIQDERDPNKLTPIEVDDSVAAPLGGVHALERTRVTVSGTRTGTMAVGQGPATLAVDSIDRASSTMSMTPSTVSGATPYINIMCRFADVVAEPQPPSYVANMMGTGTTTPPHPSLEDYWQEVTYGNVTLGSATAVVGWLTLPEPKSGYTDGSGNWNLAKAFSDCTGLADPTVNFTNYFGINLIFNDAIGCCAWGGGMWRTLDGMMKVWPTTWLPPWAFQTQSVIAHEMGHAYGLPHSTSQYFADRYPAGSRYGNDWDVMSDPVRSSIIQGTAGQHTIAYHKDVLGHIPSTRRYVHTGGTQSITLERLAQPGASNYLMAKIPISGSATHFYTVEVRTLTGYDSVLPASAVVIHDVDTTRAEPAWVIDRTYDANTGDEGGIWSVGETFADLASGISVRVDAATATGYTVTISTGAATCVPGADGIVLYEQPSYQGACTTVTGDVADLTTSDFNDRVASVQFVGSYASGWDLVLYDSANYRGTYSVLRGSDTDLQNDTISRAHASSLQLRRTCASVAEGVVLYELPGYGGQCWAYDANTPTLVRSPWNDRAASVRLAGSFATGWDVTLYQDPNYSGASLTIEASVPDLLDTSLGRGTVSSLTMIRQCAPGSDGVVLYELPNYQGRCRTYTGSASNLGDLGFDNRAASVRFVGLFAGGWEVVLYTDANFGGASLALSADRADLQGTTIGRGSASSLTLRPASVGTATPTPTTTPTATATPPIGRGRGGAPTPSPTATPTSTGGRGRGQ